MWSRGNTGLGAQIIWNEVEGDVTYGRFFTFLGRIDGYLATEMDKYGKSRNSVCHKLKRKESVSCKDF